MKPGDGLVGHLLGAVREAVALADPARAPATMPTCGVAEAMEALATVERARGIA